MFQSRKERKGKGKKKEQGEKQKLYMINVRNALIITSKMRNNLMASHCFVYLQYATSEKIFVGVGALS